jgi:hypothetical protein
VLFFARTKNKESYFILASIQIPLYNTKILLLLSVDFETNVSSGSILQQSTLPSILTTVGLYTCIRVLVIK